MTKRVTISARFTDCPLRCNIALRYLRDLSQTDSCLDRFNVSPQNTVGAKPDGRNGRPIRFNDANLVTGLLAEGRMTLHRRHYQ
jgi:hypothetical protein